MDDLTKCFGSQIKQEIPLNEGPPSSEKPKSSCVPQIYVLYEELKGIKTLTKLPEHGSPITLNQFLYLLI